MLWPEHSGVLHFITITHDATQEVMTGNTATRLLLMHGRHEAVLFYSYATVGLAYLQDDTGASATQQSAVGGQKGLILILHLILSLLYNTP